jgi:hypothetical protein
MSVYNELPKSDGACLTHYYSAHNVPRLASTIWQFRCLEAFILAIFSTHIYKGYAPVVDMVFSTKSASVLYIANGTQLLKVWVQHCAWRIRAVHSTSLIYLSKQHGTSEESINFRRAAERQEALSNTRYRFRNLANNRKPWRHIWLRLQKGVLFLMRAYSTFAALGHNISEPNNSRAECCSLL